MKDGILKHFLTIGIGTLINMLLGLLTTPIITRIVDPAEYGQFSLFTTYASMAMIVLCLGLDQSLVRFFYEKKNLEYRRALLFRCLVFPVACSVAVGVIFFLLTYFGVIPFEFDALITGLLCLFVFAQLVYRFSLLIVRLEYRSRTYSILNIAHKAFYIVIALGLIAAVGKNYLLMLVLATVAAEMLCAFISIYTQRDVWRFGRMRMEDCNISIRELIKYGYPFILTLGITSLMQSIDKLSLNHYCDYTEVGVYASAMTLINVFSIMQTSFNALWAPMAVEHYSDAPDDRTFYRQGNRIITPVMFFIGLSLILVKDIFILLLGEKYRYAAYIMPFLAFQPIMYTISETTVSGLVFMKKSGLQIWAAVGACLTNFVGNTILVPRLGGQGAAISTGLSYIVYFTIRTFLSNRYFYVDFGLKDFYLLTAATAAYALYSMFHSFGVGSVIGYVACVVLMFVLYRSEARLGISCLKERIRCR